MSPGTDGESAHGRRRSPEPRETVDLVAGSAHGTADTAALPTDAPPMIRPAVTDETVPGLPTIARSPRRIAPTEPSPSRSGRRAPAVALVLAVAVLLAGALMGRLTAPRTAVTAVPTATGADVIATAPPVAPPPSAVPTMPDRPADALAPWASRVGVVVDIPVIAVQAYGYAQIVLFNARPDCHLGWTTLAGIGEVASHHGQAGGTVLDRGGRTSPPIVGPPLDGRDGRALVTDTDAGAYDGDANYDRSMGPLLLLPAMWRVYASDGDDDQIQDPYDIDDASVAVGRLLCAGSEDLNKLSGWTAALARLQPGEAYARAVFQAADSYGQQSRNIE